MDMTPLWISLRTASCATIITFFAGILAAHRMSYSGFRFKGLLDGLFILPMVLPPTVVGFLLLVFFGKNGPVGKLLLQLGITIVFSWPATVVAASVVAFPLMYKTARGAFEQVDPDLLDAARTIGCTEWAIFWRITLPLSLPGVIAGTILSFARALGEFGATLMLAGNIPGRTQTIPVAIFFAVEGGNRDKALAWVVILTGVSLISAFLINRWSRRQPLAHRMNAADRRL